MVITMKRWCHQLTCTFSSLATSENTKNGIPKLAYAVNVSVTSYFLITLNSKNIVQNCFESWVLYYVYICIKQVALLHYEVHMEEINWFGQQEYVTNFPLLTAPTKKKKSQPPLRNCPDFRNNEDLRWMKRDGFGFFFFSQKILRRSLFYFELSTAVTQTWFTQEKHCHSFVLRSFSTTPHRLTAYFWV